MKQINNFIIEKFKISSNTIQKIKPKSRKELRDIIIKALDEDGPDASLNHIDTSLITDMNHLFSRISSKVGDIDVSDWDVHNVENMAFIFANCNKFNCDISKWNTENVKDMSAMFYGCSEFNQDISNWDVSNVENFEEMFEHCKKFNTDISQWDVSKGNNFNRMFYNAESFSCKKLENWKLKTTYKIRDMFKNTKMKSFELPKWYKE